MEVCEEGTVPSCGAAHGGAVSVTRKTKIGGHHFAVGASVPRESRLGVLVLVPDIEKLPVAPYAPTSPHPQSSATTRAHHAKATHDQRTPRTTQAWRRWKVLWCDDGRKDAHMKRKLGLGAAPPATMSGIEKVARAAPREWTSNRATIVHHTVRAGHSTVPGYNLYSTASESTRAQSTCDRACARRGTVPAAAGDLYPGHSMPNWPLPRNRLRDHSRLRSAGRGNA